MTPRFRLTCDDTLAVWLTTPPGPLPGGTHLGQLVEPHVVDLDPEMVVQLGRLPEGANGHVVRLDATDHLWFAGRLHRLRVVNPNPH